MNKWLKLGRRESSSWKWLISIELLELENGRLGTIKIVLSHKNPLQLPKLWSRVWWGVWYLHSLEAIPNNVFTYYKEKSSKLQGGESWQILINQVIKVSITGNRTHNFLQLLMWCSEKHPTLLCDIPTKKMHSLNLNMRDHQTNLNWGTLYKINGLCSLKISVL